MNVGEQVKYILDNSNVTNLFASVIHRKDTGRAESYLRELMATNKFPGDVYDWLTKGGFFDVTSRRPEVNGASLSKEEFAKKVEEEYIDLKKYKNSQNSRNRSASGNTVAGNAVRKYSSNGNNGNNGKSGPNSRKSRKSRKNRNGRNNKTRKNRKNE